MTIDHTSDDHSEKKQTDSKIDEVKGEETKPSSTSKKEDISKEPSEKSQKSSKKTKGVTSEKTSSKKRSSGNNSEKTPGKRLTFVPKKHANLEEKSEGSGCVKRKFSWEEVYAAYLDYFKRENIKYQTDSTDPYCCHATFSRESGDTQLPNLMMSFKINFDVQCVLIRTVIMHEFFPHNRIDIMEYITLKNTHFLFGKYIMDDRLVAFHYNAEFSNIGELNDEFIKRSIMIPLETLKIDEVNVFRLMIKPNIQSENSLENQQIEKCENNSDKVHNIEEIKQSHGPLSREMLFKMICATMDRMNYTYTEEINEDNDEYKLRASFQIPKPLDVGRLFIDILGSVCLFRFELDTKVKKSNRSKMNEIISRVNYQTLSLGNFEMAPQDGRLFFRYSLSYEHIAKIDTHLIEHFIRVTIDSFDIPDPELVEVLLGKSMSASENGKQSKEEKGKLIFFNNQNNPNPVKDGD